jgi:hypothetical protein
LRETQIDLVVLRIWKNFKFPDYSLKAYRSFELGVQTRKKILNAMMEKKFLALHDQDLERAVRSIEVFQAVLAGWVNVKGTLGQLEGPPLNYMPDDSWVWLPIL